MSSVCRGRAGEGWPADRDGGVARFRQTALDEAAQGSRGTGLWGLVVAVSREQRVRSPGSDLPTEAGKE
jgi:hypothetical protein